MHIGACFQVYTCTLYMHVFMQCLVGIECTVYIICMVGGALGGKTAA